MAESTANSQGAAQPNVKSPGWELATKVPLLTIPRGGQTELRISIAHLVARTRQPNPRRLTRVLIESWQHRGGGASRLQERLSLRLNEIEAVSEALRHALELEAQTLELEEQARRVAIAASERRLRHR